jgi:hypothetical protein
MPWRLKVAHHRGKQALSRQLINEYRAELENIDKDIAAKF